jgi:dolichol-phosphate mannosyltransferase
MSESVQVSVVIPTLNPTGRLTSIISSLLESGVDEVLVIDDGSRSECSAIFDQIASMPKCRVLHHECNRGKGAALKTAFRDYLERFPDGAGVITTDDDGQHKVSDILNIAQMLSVDENKNKLLLGVRDFSSAGVPWKSRFGNRMTSLVFRIFAKIVLCDTQTGLRGIPPALMRASLELPGNRFEMETEMLIEAPFVGVEFCEVPIETIYFEANKATHFHPIKDAVRIYRAIFRALKDQRRRAKQK